MRRGWSGTLPDKGLANSENHQLLYLAGRDVESWILHEFPHNRLRITLSCVANRERYGWRVADFLTRENVTFAKLKA